MKLCTLRMFVFSAFNIGLAVFQCTRVHIKFSGEHLIFHFKCLHLIHYFLKGWKNNIARRGHYRKSVQINRFPLFQCFWCLTVMTAPRGSRKGREIGVRGTVSHACFHNTAVGAPS